MHDDVYFDFTFKPIVKDFARLQNLISQCQNLSGIGLELVFFGRNLFFLEMVSGIVILFNINIRKVIW
jgi:hypothetical protein